MTDATGRPVGGREYLDVWAHVLPYDYLERINRLIADSKGAITIPGYEEWPNEFPGLTDMDLRWRAIEGMDGYRQIVSLSVPPIEDFGEPGACADLARLGNEEMAALTEKYPEHVAGFVAGIPLNDVAASVAELERAVTELGAVGVQIYTNAHTKPVDGPEFETIFAKAAELNVGVWLHPTRYKTVADYATESISRYGLWWSIGWPYESAATMARLAFSGLFKRHPDLPVITHHGGGLVPHFPDRLVSFGIEEAVVTTDDPWGELMGELRKFYPDTVMGTHGAMQSSVEFFGVDKVLFGTDMPYGVPDVVQRKMALVESLALADEDKEKIFQGNARGLLR